MAETLQMGAEASRKSWEPSVKGTSVVLPTRESGSGEPPHCVPSSTGKLQGRRNSSAVDLGTEGSWDSGPRASRAARGIKVRGRRCRAGPLWACRTPGSIRGQYQCEGKRVHSPQLCYKNSRRVTSTAAGAGAARTGGAQTRQHRSQLAVSRSLQEGPQGPHLRPPELPGFAHILSP